MTPLSIKRIYIDIDISEYDLVKEILARIPGVPVSRISNRDELPRQRYTIASGKHILYLTKHKGEFCKPCPGTDEAYICCNYYVINEMTGCPLDCRYCILQDYLETSVLTVFVNFDQIFNEFYRLQEAFPERLIRIGTGELADSLATEPLTGLSEHLIPYFSARKNTLFELKTKTDLFPYDSSYKHLNNIVLSWSLNPEHIIKVYEKKASTLKQRIKAAKQAQERGFKLSFHFDPVIHHQGWKENYGRVIELLFSEISSDRIIWISLGGLRFSTDMKTLIHERFPGSALIHDEQVPGMDKKIRYFKPLRAEMFSYIYKKIRTYSEDVFVYFCMEDKKIWEKTMGFSPINSNHLDFLFAESIYNRFPDLELAKPDFEYYQSLKIKHDPVRQKYG